MVCEECKGTGWVHKSVNVRRPCACRIGGKPDELDPGVPLDEAIDKAAEDIVDSL